MRSQTDGYGGSGSRPADAPDERIAAGLGWFSIGLGLVQLLKPGALARLIGVRDDGTNRSITRLVGVREIGAGVGILWRPGPAGWAWARIAGDAMDLALLGAALNSKRRGRGWGAALRSKARGRDRVAAATAAVAGITALYLFDALQLSRRGRGTEVYVEMEYTPPGGVIGATVAKLFAEEPGQQVDVDLRAFKQVMEIGEVVHSEASIHALPHPAQPPEAGSPGHSLR